MPKLDGGSCEPFRAWNRLEPRPRKVDFDDVLQCAVHDPLWMLTRQWQFGEFKGEDTGSAIFSKLKIHTTLPGLYKSKAGNKEVYSDEIPVETKVERENPLQDYRAKVEAGMYFIKLMDSYFTNPVLIPGYDHNVYVGKLRQLFPLQLPPAIVPLDDHTRKVKKLKSFVNEPLVTFLETFAKRGFDGKDLYEKTKLNTSAVAASFVGSPAITAKMVTTLTDYIKWYEKTYKPNINAAASPAWVKEQMEYQFSLALPEKSGSNTALFAQEYYSGDLEWYSFDVDQTLKLNDELLTTPLPADKQNETVITVIPTIAKYAGMPHPRYWQFEDGDVDLTNVDADTTDISKIVVSEYAFIYANDWLIVPWSLPAGSLTDVKGIVVTDVFGQKSYIQAAVQGQTNDWSSWGMFNLSISRPNQLLAQNLPPVPTDTRLFLPPCVAKTMESEPIEEIHFVKDEMANLVWAIETKINNAAGGYIDGQTFSTYLKNALEKIEPPEGAVPIDKDAMFKYTLENTVPENWIPFVPVHIPNSNRAIRLQRASMPRWFMNEYAAVRPNTQLLREGLNDNDVVTQPLFVNEEEVPRAGCKVSSSFQRTRWYNGAVVNWIGRRKKSGRGEGSSGLQFDTLEALKKKTQK